MAILSFWSDQKKETGQTLSIVAIATYMSIERNYRTLVIDATFDDDTMERCFWNIKADDDIKKTLNKGKIDVASGTKGLMNAVASNKTTPEIIANYARVVFNKRLDILVGVKNQTSEEYVNSFKLYNDLLLAATKYYDLVIIDLPKTRQLEGLKEILNKSDMVAYTMSQNLGQINHFRENKEELEKFSSHMVPFFGNVDLGCKYNPKNVASYLKAKKLGYVTYNNSFLEAANESKVSDYFLKTRLSKKNFDQNTKFFQSLDETSKKIIQRFEEIKYGRMSRS